MADDETDNQDSAKPTFVKRITDLLFGSIFGIVGVVSALLGIAGLAGFLLFSSSDDDNLQSNVSIESAIELFQKKEYAAAREQALVLNDSEELEPDQEGIPVFLIGMDIVKNKCEIETQNNARQGMYLIASRYFDEAALRGVPPHMVPITNYWWGKSLYEAGELPSSRLPLQVALNGLSNKRKELLNLLTDVHLEDPKLNPNEGYAYIESLLTEFQDELEPTDIHLATVKKARLKAKQFKFAEAINVLKSLPEDSPIADKITYQMGKVYLAEAARLEELRKDEKEIKKVFVKAVETLRGLPLLEIDDDRRRAQALMDLGLAYKGQGDLGQAENRFTYVRRQFFDQPVGIAAGFYEALCQLELGDDKRAMKSFGRLLREAVQTNIQGDSTWIDATFLNKTLRQSIELLLERDLCQQCVDLTKKFRTAADLREPKVPLDVVAELEVKTYTRWIQILDEEMEKADHQHKISILEEWKEKQRLLGHALYSLARHRFSGKEHAGELFLSGEAFLKAEDYLRAITTLREYLSTNDKYQPSRARLLIGKCFFAQGKFRDAIESFSYCWIVHPNDPSVYEARFNAAECHLELSEPALAREMLNGNLDDGNLTPRSKEWIESKYLLGNILYEEALLFDSKSRSLPDPTVGNDTTQEANSFLEKASKKYYDAILKLNEALIREPDLPQAKLGRYRLAEAYRRAVAWKEVQLNKTTRNAKRTELTTSIDGNLHKSIAHLALLEEKLIGIRDNRPLDEIEIALLRNSFFIRGQLFYRLNKFEQSIKMYQSASNMVLQQPEVLEAYAQMAQCYRHLGRKDDVKRVVDQAKILLRDRIPTDVDFGGTTRFQTRERWVAHLDWLSSI